MCNSKLSAKLFGSVIVLSSLGLSSTAHADSGYYMGASLGTATVSIDIPDPGIGDDINFDEGDFAWKVYGGYAFDLPVIDFGVEIGYFNLGSPAADVIGEQLEISVSGFEAFALAGVDIGPAGLFVKGGIVSWDADISIADDRESDDANDPAYGVGLRFNFGSVEIRGEYEVFDIDSTEDIYMASAGFVWHF